MPVCSVQTKTICYRAVLPCLLLGACVIRPSLMSLVYGILALLCPVLPEITPTTGVRALTKVYLGLSVVICFLFSVLQLAFQIWLSTTEPYGHTLPSCNSTELFWRQFGFFKLSATHVANDIRVVGAEILALVASAFTFYVCAISRSPEQAMGFDPIPGDGTSSTQGVNGTDKETHTAPEGTQHPGVSVKDRILQCVYRASDVIAVFLLCLVGTVWPCLLSLPYFLTFLALVLWWSAYKPVRRPCFNMVKIFLIIYTAFHLVLLYLYQLPALQGQWNPDHFKARLIGLTAILNSTECVAADIWSLKFSTQYWSFFAHPVFLVLFYFYISFQVRATYGGMHLSPAQDMDPLVSDASSVHEEFVGPDSEDDKGAKQRPPVRRIVSVDPKFQSRHPKLAEIISFLIRHSFTLSLLCMMAWAIIFHTWLGFVWLILACLIWIVPDSQRVCFRFSPVVVFFCTVFLCIPFFITLRLHLREKFYGNLSAEDRQERRNYGTFASASGREYSGSRESLIAGTWLERFLGKYWIYVVALVLLLISIRNPVVMYNAGYMIFFSLLIIFIQFSVEFLVKTLFFYWTLLVVYSSFVLLWIYLYQFEGIPGWWGNTTELSREWNEDLGLESYDAGTLFLKLLTPISFLVVVILQLKFFHRVFRRITNISTTRGTGERQELTHDASLKEWTLYWLNETINVLWRVAEIHARKVLLFGLFMLAIYEVSVMNLFLVILIVFMIPCRLISGFLCVLTTVLLSGIVLAKMLFQMHFVSEDIVRETILDGDCASRLNITNESEAVTGLAEWAGFAKITNIGWYLRGYIIVLVLLAFRAIIFYRQKFHREVMNEATPERGVIFPEVKRDNADDSVINCLKFFANYFFYKFGVEICFITTVAVAAIRMDAVGLVYLFGLLVLFMVSRRMKARLWWFYVIFLSLILPLEYASCVGLPPTACIGYPWQDWSPHLIVWLYLPDYNHSPNAKFLIADFFQLLFAVCQLFVFYVERGSHGQQHNGGDNSEIVHHVTLPEEPPPTNPVNDYITDSKSVLDVVKGVFFPYIHWITLIILFVAGLGAVSLFALGYLITAFVFLWQGNQTYLKPMSKVIRWWRMVAYYNILVILIKTALQVVGCVYYDTLTGTKTYCWVVQLFSIACVRQNVPGGANENCSVRKSEADLQFDVLCLVFLLLQLRIFGSWYFKHVVTEFRAQKILSSRGAVLVNQLILKEMKQQQHHERRRLAQIKERTRQIREQQERNLPRGVKRFEPETYADAKRAGDYHDFDYDPDLPGEDELTIPERTVPEPTLGADEQKGLTPLQLVHTAITKDMDMEETVSATTEAEQAPKDHRGAVAVSGGGQDTAYVAPPMVEEDQIVEVPPPEGSKEVKGEDGEQKKKTKGKASGEKEEEESKGKIAAALAFIMKLFSSLLDFLTVFCNRRSRDHRYVAWVLHKEKVLLKQKLAQESVDSRPLRELRQEIMEGDLGDQIRCVRSQEDITTMEKEIDEYWTRYNAAVRFLVAVGYLLLSRTELLCYLMMVSDHMRTAAIISLPLPLLAFFWGTLCSPRPPKFFWIVIIAYTEAVVIVKFVFQFAFFQWNSSNDSSPFWAPRILGIEIQEDFATLDVALLIVLFFHRYMLRNLGLWKDSEQTASLVHVVEEEPCEKSTQSGEAKSDSFELQDLNTSEQTKAPTKSAETIENEQEKDGKETESNVSFLAYLGSFGSFYSRLLNPTFRYIRDLYAFMFLCDCLCFLICMFGYQYFGVTAGSGSVLADVTSNRVPLPFVLILMTLTFLMIIDRALYLRKTTVGRLIFQYALVVGAHVYIFFVLPAITDRSTKLNHVAQLWYFVKCVYFLFSAWQIKNGYPSQILGNLLTRSYGLVSFAFFKVFMAFPFLFELRTVIDWVWTDTSMPLFDFFNLESFYAILYGLKCSRKLESDFPAPRGQPKGVIVKYAMGGGLLIVICGLVWLPLLVYALLNMIGERVLPNQVQLSVFVEGYPPLYTMEATTVHISALNEKDYITVSDYFAKNRSAWNFIREYSRKDIVEVEFRPDSLRNWGISNPSREALKTDLGNSTQKMSLVISWSFRRPSTSSKKSPILHTGSHLIELEHGGELRDNILKIIEQNKGAVGLINALPPYIMLPSSGDTQLATTLLDAMGGTNQKGFSEAFADAKLSIAGKGDDAGKYWMVSNLTGPARKNKFMLPSRSLSGEGDGLLMIAFVDKLFPSALSSLVSTGIIAMYVAVVYIASRALRGVVAKEPLSLVISEMPYVDRLLSICFNVYLVREAKDFTLEQDLYAKLVFLFRSPETLIKWTRPKQKRE